MKASFYCIVLTLILLITSCRNEQKIKIHAQRPVKIPKRNKSVKPAAVIPADSISITAVGDIMLGSSYPDTRTLPPDSGKSSFEAALDELRSTPVTFGNLEGTLLNTGAPAHYKLHLLTKGYLFRMPEDYGGILKKAGFNLLSLANNHIGDFGDNGRINTMKVLDSLGINYGGQLSHPSAIFKLKGVTFGFCAFAPNSHTLSILDIRQAREIIRNLKQQCDIVIVSFHGGGEGAAFEHIPFKMESYYNEKRGNVHAFAHQAIDAGADVLLGNGPHVCRALEIYKKRLIAYSLGNFYTYRNVNVLGICGLAPLLKININKKGEFLNGRIVSYKQTHGRRLQIDSLNTASKKIKLLTLKDFPNTKLLITDDGRISPVHH